MKAGRIGVVDGNGGKQKRFHIKDLPEDIQVAYAASLNLTLEAFQGEVKPAPNELRQFYRAWLKPYAQAGLAGLVPQYKKRGGAGSSLTPEVKNLLEYLYLDTNRIGVADAVRHIQKVYGHEDVSEITARRYLMSIPQAVREVWRSGSAYLEKVQPSVQRDYTLYKPMEVIVGDYMTQDFMLRLKGNVYRAKVVAFMDMRTRAIVGWSLQLTSNSKGVAIALQKCFDRFGLPEYIYFDNGREFKNQFLCGDVWKTRISKIDAEDLGQNIGVVVEAGVKVIFAIPYNGKAKPIERFWRTLHEQFDKWMPTYLGSNTALSTDESKVYRQNVRKMKREDFEKIPEFLAVEKELGNFFEHYNNCHEHTGQGMDGKTPMQVWSENSVPKREVPAELKPYLFTHRYMRTVGKDGISFDGGYYYAPEVIKYLGQRVQIRVPLDSDDVLYVFSPDGKKLFDAVYRDDGINVKEKIEKVGKRKKANLEFIKGYNAQKEELDKQAFQTVSDSWAQEHPELVPQATPELRVVNGDPLPAEEPPKPVKSTLIKLFK